MKPEIADDIELLVKYAECQECDHQCTGNCRRVGCNCECGEFHTPAKEAAERVELYLATYKPEKT